MGDSDFSFHGGGINMERFLALAHVDTNDEETRRLLQSLKITHWSYFTLSTEADLRALGFAEGPARLLCMAVGKANELLS